MTERDQTKENKASHQQKTAETLLVKVRRLGQLSSDCLLRPILRDQGQSS